MTFRQSGSYRKLSRWRRRSLRSRSAAPLLVVTTVLVCLLATAPLRAFSFVLFPYEQHVSSSFVFHRGHWGRRAFRRLDMAASSTGTMKRHWNDTVSNPLNGKLPPITTLPGTSSHWKSLESETVSSSESTATTLGDIMGLVTESEGLSAHYGIDHPLDRMALTANGNLQRLVSSYYDAPVSVVVDYCHERDATDVATWDRRVSLQVFGQTFCVATSVIRVRDKQCVAWVESGQVGLGQLFRELNVLPTFSLQRAGVVQSNATNNNTEEPTPGGGGGFWREYSLTCAELSCDIREEFVVGLWALQPSR
eukprot:scaffold823_cov219-Amphora_coffeaeformis.AAC.6